jgi:tetratricopeptide (TPR) repeat protein
MRPITKSLALVVLVACASCATTTKEEASRIDEIEQLRQSAKKVDHAIVETKRIIQQSRGADYLPDMYMRLAELYTARARYAWLVVYEMRQKKGDTSHAIDAPEAALLKNLAIGVYDRLLKEFPTYKRADTAQFLLAHEYRELGQYDQMRQAYEKLIETYPKSQHRLEAYLVLGDTEFDKGDLNKAERYYSLILAEPESHVHGLARYKLGWVRVNKEDCKGAVRLFEKILRDKNANSQSASQPMIKTQKNLNIRREALVDLAYCYPEVYPERPAAPFMRELADSSADYLAAMRRLSKRFSLKEMWLPAAAALREVLAGPIDEDAVELVRKLYDTVSKAKSYDWAQVDVEHVGRVIEDRYYDVHVPKDKRDRLLTEFEVYARDLATKAHLAAKESKVAREFANAAQAYTAYLKYFPNAKSRPEIEQNRAEALAQTDATYDAGQAFERVAALMAKDPAARKQALLNSIAAYQRTLERQDLPRMERLGSWGALRVVGAQFLAENPGDAKVPLIKFALARSYYDSGDYRKATELFYALLRQFPGSNEAQVSGHLALDSLRVIEDFETLAALGHRIMNDGRITDAKFKQEVADIVTKSEQRQVTELTITSAGNQEDALVNLAKRNKGSGLGEEALYNALLVARDHGDSDRFYSLGEEFLQQYPKSSRRADVQTALSNVALDRADFVQAARYLEASYSTNPNGKGASDKLFVAASIYSFLGNTRAAALLKALVQGAGGGPRIDEMLLVLARSGNFSALEDVLRATNLSGPVAEFLRGYLAFSRGDKEEAHKLLVDVARGRSEGEGPAAEAVAKARFLVGDLTLDGYNAYQAQGDLAKTLTEKSALLAEVDKAYAQAIATRHGSWAFAALVRVSSAYAQFAQFLRDLKLPDSASAEEQKQLRAALGAKAEDAEKRATELRDICAKRAREAVAFSQAVRACLTGEPLPDHIPMFAKAPTSASGEPPGATTLRQALLKDPRNTEKMLKLAELYMGAGDLSMALLILDRADENNDRSSHLHNLRGVALSKVGEADTAFAEFQKAVQLDTQNSRARLNLAAHYAQYGYNTQALAELKKAGVPPTVLGDVAEHPALGGLSKLSPQQPHGGKK